MLNIYYLQMVLNYIIYYSIHTISHFIIALMRTVTCSTQSDINRFLLFGGNANTLEININKCHQNIMSYFTPRKNLIISHNDL